MEVVVRIRFCTAQSQFALIGPKRQLTQHHKLKNSHKNSTQQSNLTLDVLPSDLHCLSSPSTIRRQSGQGCGRGGSAGGG